MVPEGSVEYDKWGNVVYLASLDGKGNLIRNPQTGWSYMKCEYDIKGNVLWKSFFDEKEKAVLCQDGFHKVVYTYTNADQIESISYFDTSEKPMSVLGYHKVLYKYDENDLCIENTYLGTTGKEKNNAYGYSKLVTTYTKDKIYRDRKYYTASGKLLYHEQYTNGSWGEVKNWQKDFADFADELPVDLGEDLGNLIIKSARIVNSSLVEIVMATPKSKYDMADSAIDIYKQALIPMIEYFKTELELPKNVIVKGILQDSKGRELLTVKK